MFIAGFQRVKPSILLFCSFVQVVFMVFMLQLALALLQCPVSTYRITQTWEKLFSSYFTLSSPVNKKVGCPCIFERTIS